MLEKPIESVTLEDLEALVTNNVSESRYIEFKRDLPGQDGEQIREFLADVTSFANSSGGDLIFGIEEQDGVASTIIGVTIADADAEILRLENSIRSNVDPKMVGVKSHFVTLSAAKGVLIIRIPPGYQPPHRVTFRNSGKFYSRNSRGKFEMDVHELRYAFTQAAQEPSFFYKLHAEGIDRAKGIDMPFAVDVEPTAVISVIPLSLFREGLSLPITEDNALVPFRPSGYSAIPMIEGVLIHTPVKTETGRVRSFAITYRGGRSDFVFTFGRTENTNQGKRWFAYPKLFEEGLATAVNGTLSRLSPLGVAGPWVILASVFGVKGHVAPMSDLWQSAPAYKDQAFLGEVRFENLEAETLLPIAKNIWLLFAENRPENWSFPAKV